MRKPKKSMLTKKYNFAITIYEKGFFKLVMSISKIIFCLKRNGFYNKNVICY